MDIRVIGATTSDTVGTLSSVCTRAAADLRIVVYDMLGRAVATLAERRFDAGPHRLALDASALPSGLYVVRAVVGSFVSTHRVMVVR